MPPIEPVTSKMTAIGSVSGCSTLSRLSRAPSLSLRGSSAAWMPRAFPVRTAWSWPKWGRPAARRALIPLV